MIHPSLLPDVAIPEVPITAYVFADAARRADKAALVDGPTGRILTYGALVEAICSLAGGLVEQGFAKGDVLALMAPNLPEYAVVFHAVAMAGGAVTTLNPVYTEREIHHQLIDSDARLLVTTAPFVDVARVATIGTRVAQIYLIDPVPEGCDARPLADLFGPPLVEQVPVGLDDVVVLPYSSGTTGVNKGVMLTHRNLVANIAQLLGAAEVREDEKFVAVLPFFHIYGMQVLMNGGLCAGTTIITVPKFELEQFLRLHMDYAVTRAFVAPPIVIALAKHPIVDNYDLSTLERIFCAAAPLSAELAIEAGSRLDCEVVQGYGMTELSPISHLTPPGRGKPGSVGMTAPNTELRIVDPLSGEDLELDVDGELWIRGPQVMKGYLNNPTATAMTLDPDGWLRTGDIGHIDADGHVYVVDRLKELIKCNGFQVAPAELEAVLLTHPAVADAAVVGRPDDKTGEIPVAFVVLRPGHDVSADEVAAYVASQVAPFKRLGQVNFIDAIPKSAAGKILRRLLPSSTPSAR